MRPGIVKFDCRSVLNITCADIFRNSLTTSTYLGQSGHFGTNEGDHICDIGTCDIFIIQNFRERIMTPYCRSELNQRCRRS